MTLPGDPPMPVGHLHVISADAAGDGGHLRRARLQRRRGPGGRVRLLQLHCAEHPRASPGAADAGQLLLRRPGGAADAHLADAGAIDGGEAAAHLHRGARAGPTGATPTPPTRRCSTSSRGSRSTRTSRWPTCAACCSSSSRRCSAASAQIRLRSGYFPFTEPSVEVDVSCFSCDTTRPARRRLALPALQGVGLDRDRGRRNGRPQRARLRRSSGYDAEQVQGFAFGFGIDRIAMLKHGVPDLRMMFENDVRFLEQFGGSA